MNRVCTVTPRPADVSDQLLPRSARAGRGRPAPIPNGHLRGDKDASTTHQEINRDGGPFPGFSHWADDAAGRIMRDALEQAAFSRNVLIALPRSYVLPDTWGVTQFQALATSGHSEGPDALPSSLPGCSECTGIVHR